jgi:hypothetical protein
MKGNYKTGEIKPTVKSKAAFAAGDILFDWIAVEIPKGTVKLKDISGYILGTNGAAQAGELFSLIFAKSINNVAPPSIGSPNDTMDKQKSILARDYIQGFFNVDMGEQADSVLDSFVVYSLLGKNYSTTTPTAVYPDLILDGELVNDNPGYQTIYVAGIAEAVFDFGTGVLVNDADGHDADVLTIPVDAVDPREIFAVGDVIYASNATTDGTKSADMTVQSLGANSIVVDSSPAIANNFEFGPVNPISLRLGFEY